MKSENKFYYQDACGQTGQAQTVKQIKKLYKVTFEDGEPEFVVSHGAITELNQYVCNASNKGQITGINLFSDHVLVAN